jgi:P27 family predicted phage terminase small subunit
MAGKKRTSGLIETRRKLSKPSIVSMVEATQQIKKAEIKDDPAARPDMPDGLDKDAREEWERIVGYLAPTGRLAKMDRTALLIYVDAYATFMKAGRHLNKPGQSPVMKSKTGTPVRNPWFDIRKQAAADMCRYLALFGMSPMDRVKMLKPTGEKPQAPGNPYDEF